MEDVRSPIGFVNAFKPPGPSSTAFGSWVRRRLRATSLGHWGTLDPAALGVLVLAVGRATRLIPYLASGDKSYVFEMRVGVGTDSGDATGNVVRTSGVPADWAASIDEIAASFVGPLLQTPPMYSAVKVDGQPLYKAARAGQEVERRSRGVEIRALRVIDAKACAARFALDCSSGTYVRTLCEQIGERLGVAAHMGTLLRTRAGPFDLEHSRTPDEIDRDPGACVVDPRTVLDMHVIDIDEAAAEKFAHGNAADIAADSREGDGGLVLVVHRGALIGVGRLDDTLVPVRVLRPDDENS